MNGQLTIRCSKCQRLAGMPGEGTQTREAMRALAEHLGWHLGAKPICPQCRKRTEKKDRLWTLWTPKTH